MNSKTKPLTALASALAALMASAQTPTPIPASFALPAGAVDTGKPGFLAQPYQTSASQPNSLAWTEDQFAGLHGPNLADLSGANAAGFYTITTVVNWNIADGGTVDSFQPADPFPGIGASGTENFSENVLTYLTFPAAGVYTLGVNSDDGFRVTVSPLNPKNRFSALTLGEWDAGRGATDTTFQVSVTEAGTYPFRLLYEQGGGDANVSWFSVLGDGTKVLINDTTQPDAIKAYSVSSVAPPYVSSFVHSGTGFTVGIKNDASALNPASLVVKFNGGTVPTVANETNGTTFFTYTSPNLIPPGSSNDVQVDFGDTSTPPITQSVPINYVESFYTSLSPSFALPAGAVDTSLPGFQWRVHQIDSNAAGVLAANIAHAEAQLAGLLIDPSTGLPYVSIASAGDQPDGSFTIPGTLNLSLDPATEQGNFTSATGYPDVAIPGIASGSGDNIAGEVITYLQLQPGYYQFGMSSSDGFRVTVGPDARDAFSTQLGIYDSRRITRDTTFSFAVQAAGIYPIRIVWFRQSNLPNNGTSTPSFELYTIAADGAKLLVNDSTQAQAVKAYWKRTGAYGPYVKYAGPTSFISDFRGADVGFKSVDCQISDGSTTTVDKNTVTLAIDGTNVTVTASTTAGITSASFVPTGLLLPRTLHSAQLVYGESGGGALHTNTWQFNGLRNYVLPAPLFAENFDSTAQGSFPPGWVEENFTGHQTEGLDPADLTSDFYLGWVVIENATVPPKASGVAPNQELNGVLFDDANLLLSGNSLYAESDSRQNGPPGQIQYLTTPSYNLTGKTGIVISFTSAFEQNQDSINAVEYSADGGTNWHPVVYLIQGPDDGQAASDVLRDNTGHVDAVATLTASYNDVAQYTNSATGLLVGGYYGFFLKSPITPELAPYIEGRVNDDGNESKRIELFHVPLADNAANVKFRFVQAGTSSWYWGADNWGIYSVPSLVPPVTVSLSYVVQDNKLVLTYTGVLQSVSVLTGEWQNVSGATSPYTVDSTAGGNSSFFRTRN